MKKKKEENIEDYRRKNKELKEDIDQLLMILFLKDIEVYDVY
jgi:hypothetical protein